VSSLSARDCSVRIRPQCCKVRSQLDLSDKFVSRGKRNNKTTDKTLTEFPKSFRAALQCSREFLDFSPKLFWNFYFLFLTKKKFVFVLDWKLFQIR
jgi:hypothetical protein